MPNKWMIVPVDEVPEQALAALAVLGARPFDPDDALLLADEYCSAYARDGRESFVAMKRAALVAYLKGEPNECL